MPEDYSEDAGATAGRPTNEPIRGRGAVETVGEVLSAVSIVLRLQMVITNTEG